MKSKGALVVLVAACGSPATVSLDEFPAAAQDALCAWAARCRHVPDDATCRRLIDPRDYDTRRGADAIAAGRMAWDAEAAARCLAELAEDCCLAVPFEQPSCAEVWRGLVPQGGACTSFYECADHAGCSGQVCDAACCAGTCGAPQPPPDPIPLCETPPGEPGDACDLGTFCVRGDLYCDSVSGTCRAYAGAGEPCGPAAPCDPPWAFCDGTCRPRPGLGEPCDLAERICIAATFCDLDTGTCAAPRPAGAPCTLDEQCEIACDPATGCVPYQTCTP